MNKTGELRLAILNGQNSGTCQAGRVATIGNNGYNSLRRNFLSQISRIFAKLVPKRKESCGFSRNEIITKTVTQNSSGQKHFLKTELTAEHSTMGKLADKADLTSKKL